MGKFYITTAIDYANGAPHIGHALEKIQADVLARYRRQKNDSVFFLTGTDEHGAKNVKAAEKAGKTPQELVDENYAKFYALKNLLNLSFDDFIRTSDQQRHWPAAQKIWLKLFEAGDLYRKKYRGLYCVGHEAFITEKDLVEEKCIDHQTAPEIIEEENWFFRLSRYSQKIGKIIKSDELKIIPETRKNEILSLIESGLEDVSFSRPRKDLSWGVPVPNDSNSTMYVWCDALVNYISAIGYGEKASSFSKWWPADIHLIGKDILRFHAAIWPAMLLSAGLDLPKELFVHGHITVNGQKMSKTIGNIIDPVELVNKYGVDAARYFLLREIPSTEDGDFSCQKFEDRYNGDLANGLGNFSARVIALGQKYLGKENQEVENVAIVRAIEKAKTAIASARLSTSRI
ncbi:MAG: methionine--tRNA ligase [Patescibacteria group bacterium]